MQIKRIWLLAGLLGVLALWGCSTGSTSTTQTETGTSVPTETTASPPEPADISPTTTPVTPTGGVDLEPTPTEINPTAVLTNQADVMAVSVKGEPGAYNFSVTIRSPDEGCNQYADWWEVLNQEGELLYRRILLHSHVNEQPFTRSGGPVSIAADTTVIVRAHMNTSGYGGLVMEGSAAAGFEQQEISADFASELADTAPLPEGCNF